MTTSRPSPNIVLVAVAAIMGMLSLADVASACTAMKEVPAARACCTDRPSSECGCCGKAESSPTPVATSRAVAVAVMGAPARMNPQAASPSCGCRASAPAAPSERPTQRTASERNDVPSGNTEVFVAFTVRPAAALGHLMLPNESPLKSPLYLRTSHLLI